LGMGPLAKDLQRNVQEAAASKGKRGPRFRLYSGHDSTIQPLLGMFDSLDMNWPPYVSFFLSYLRLDVFGRRRRRERAAQSF